VARVRLPRKDEEPRRRPKPTRCTTKGLSTNIDWRDKDAYGRSLGARQRQKMQRLRKWNERFRTRDSKERNLKQALGEIDRMASAQGLPDNVRETASVIYRRALDEDLLPGRSIEGVSTSCVYAAAARMAGVPRSLDEIADVSRVEKAEIARTYRYVVRELKLEVKPADPEQYVPPVRLRPGALRGVRDAREEPPAQRQGEGRPLGQVAGGPRRGRRLRRRPPHQRTTTQAAVSEVADISEVTIRNRYHELLEAEDGLVA